MNKCILILAVCSLMFVSCIADQDYIMTNDDRKLVDSLYHQKYDSITNAIDSICALQSDSLFQIMVDSIHNDRQEQIDKILKF